MATLQPFTGSRRKLVLSIDVGTTFSGMSYAVLDPGEEPKIEPVRRYPGKANVPQDYRIPSILNYTPDGEVHSCGADAESEDTRMALEYEDLILAKWFKLHLRPHELDNEEINKNNIPPLPKGKTVVQVFADFLGYLFACAHKYISDSHPATGVSLWDSLKDEIEIVLTHPNGWEGPQQAMMREAAIMAQIIPDTPTGRDRVHFVTEGEAGLHHCLQKGSLGETMKTGERIMVVDAGGGTVDISSYVFNSTSPLSVDELSTPDCIIQGSTTVNMRAEKFLKERLASSSDLNGEETIRIMMDHFERKTKPLFSNSSTRGCYIPTGIQKVDDEKLNIKNGRLLLSFNEMLSFFQPSLDGIVNSVKRQFQSTPGRPISMVFLIGGFSANEWLYDHLRSSLDKIGLRIYRPDEHMSKAVSDGAIGYYLEHLVSSRIARATYGTPVATRFNPFDPEHRKRIDLADLSFSGIVFEDGFSMLVKKGCPVSDGQEFSEEFGITYRKPREIKEITDEILKYTGKDKNPRWRSTEPDKFKRLCLVRADLSKLEGVPFRGLVDDVYVKRFKVILRFGAETQAQIGWLEDGEEKRGPAQLVYDDDDYR
ncbi:hypothetical protein C8Q74DRAFT_1309969 [Fomes fomentarius]|nr:hypothetical protein C8Q74DRAFT_1309969 [Fomes fomentarius]